jgi:hypothetical protein
MGRARDGFKGFIERYEDSFLNLKIRSTLAHTDRQLPKVG